MLLNLSTVHYLLFSCYAERYAKSSWETRILLSTAEFKLLIMIQILIFYGRCTSCRLNTATMQSENSTIRRFPSCPGSLIAFFFATTTMSMQIFSVQYYYDGINSTKLVNLRKWYCSYYSWWFYENDMD